MRILYAHATRSSQAAVERAIRDAERKAWLDENKAAFRDANDHLEKNGLFSDDWREF